MAKRKAPSRRPARAARSRATGAARKASARKRATAAKRSTARKRTAARKTSRTAKARKPGARKTAARPAARATRKSTRRASAPKAARRKPAAARPATTIAASKPATSAAPAAPKKLPRLDRERRILREEPDEHNLPSSLQYVPHASGIDAGRAEMEQRRSQHHESNPRLTGGDVDANWEDAYFSGDEAPGGDNPTPDQEVVEEIGRSLGLEYQDNEELHDKLTERDKHRWELDPASSEDYRQRRKE
jgi:Family of unknown function (DUF6335)